MPKFEIDCLPDIMYHGTTRLESLLDACPPAAQNHWWVAFEAERDELGDLVDAEDGAAERTAYATVVFRALGLAEPGQPLAPEWARGISTPRELGHKIGFLFVTDEAGKGRAESLYGPTVEIDMTAPQILDAVDDPNASTHRGVILVLKIGLPLPLKDRAAVAEMAADKVLAESSASSHGP